MINKKFLSSRVTPRARTRVRPSPVSHEYTHARTHTRTVLCAQSIDYYLLALNAPNSNGEATIGAPGRRTKVEQKVQQKAEASEKRTVRDKTEARQNRDNENEKAGGGMENVSRSILRH